MSTNQVKRKISIFEILLLTVGLGIIGAGIYIFNLISSQGTGLYESVVFITLWLLLVFLVVVCAITENSREELGVIVNENSKEIKLLREISKEHLDEIKLLRQVLTPQKKLKK